MEIIDVHCHLIWENSDPEPFIRGCAAVGARLFNKDEPEMPDYEELLQIQMNALSDKSGGKLVEWMDEAGIDKTLLLPMDFWYWYESTGQKAGIEIEEKNRIYHQAVQNHEDRLGSLFGIDPRRKNAEELFEKGITEWAMLGLKLHPATRFYPDDQVCYPLYEKAVELKVPVVVHSGSIPAPMPAKYSQPKYLDAVAADFPDLKRILLE
jgi:predicted TIM-barrel fold metal-dependent hydrolase